jgi:hypothetical protein
LLAPPPPPAVVAEPLPPLPLLAPRRCTVATPKRPVRCADAALLSVRVCAAHGVVSGLPLVRFGGGAPGACQMPEREECSGRTGGDGGGRDGSAAGPGPTATAIETSPCLSAPSATPEELAGPGGRIEVREDASEAAPCAVAAASRAVETTAVETAAAAVLLPRKGPPTSGLRASGSACAGPPMSRDGRAEDIPTSKSSSSSSSLSPSFSSPPSSSPSFAEWNTVRTAEEEEACRTAARDPACERGVTGGEHDAEGPA